MSRNQFSDEHNMQIHQGLKETDSLETDRILNEKVNYLLESH